MSDAKEEPVEDAKQPKGSVATAVEALRRTSALISVDTILGAPPYLPRTGGLASLGYSPDQPIVIAKGCLTAGDGGGGIFFWDATTGTDDGGTFIVPGGSGVGATGAGWRRLYSGAIDVRWFGTVGDETGNDQPAIQNALNAANGSSTNLQEVVVPSGRFLLATTLTLPTGVWLRGESYAGSLCALVFNGEGSTSPPWGDGLLINGWNRVSNLCILNNNASNYTGYGIHCNGKVIIDSCSLDGWQQQLVFDGAEVSECRDCNFSNRSLSSGVGPSPSNVHIRFAAPHGRLNTGAGATNTIKVSHCNFFGNGGVFLWHEDGLAYECDFINLELINAEGTSAPAVAVFKISAAQQIHYSHVTTGDGADVPLFVIGGGAETVAANGLTIDNCWITLPKTQPFLWVQFPSEAWGVYIKNNVFINPGRSEGIIKLDCFLQNWEIAHNFYWSTVALFDGTDHLYPNGRICEPGLAGGALGIGTPSPSAAVAINEALADSSAKAIRIFDPANPTDNGNYWWLSREGKAKQWKRYSSGSKFDIPNGETVYQEFFNTAAGNSVAQPFSSATDYPMMSGLHSSDFNIIVYEMEAIGNGYNGGRYYHRKQRIAVTQYGGEPTQITTFPAYPDVFENTVGTGWATSAANMAISGGQIALTVAANPADLIAWYVQVRILSRANYGATLP